MLIDFCKYMSNKFQCTLSAYDVPVHVMGTFLSLYLIHIQVTQFFLVLNKDINKFNFLSLIYFKLL